MTDVTASFTRRYSAAELDLLSVLEVVVASGPKILKSGMPNLAFFRSANNALAEPDSEGQDGGFTQVEFWLHLGRHEIHVGQWTRWVERRGLVSQSLVLQSFFTGEFHGHMLLAGSHAPKCSRLVGVKRRSVILIEGENLINHHFESPTHATYFWDWNLKV